MFQVKFRPTVKSGKAIIIFDDGTQKLEKEIKFDGFGSRASYIKLPNNLSFRAHLNITISSNEKLRVNLLY